MKFYLSLACKIITVLKLALCLLYIMSLLLSEFFN